MAFNILLFFILIILAAADTSFFSNFFGHKIQPSALLCAVIIWSSRAEFGKVWLRSAFSGFLSDIFYWSVIGPGIFIFSFISALSGSLAKRFLPPHKSWRILGIYILIVTGTLTQNIFFEIYFRAARIFSDIPVSAVPGNIGDFKYLGLEIAINILICTLIFWPISKLDPIEGRGYKLAIK